MTDSSAADRMGWPITIQSNATEIRIPPVAEEDLIPELVALE